MSWFRRFWRYTRGMEDDEGKIKGILLKLNEEDGSDWEEIEGYHALMSVNFEPVIGARFSSGTGIIVKGFINHNTGEIKTYWFKNAVRD